MTELPELTKYLEKAIKAWTKTFESTDDTQHRIIASCYVDALQTVKTRLEEPLEKKAS